MESALTSFLATIDTPEFRRSNLAKVRAKAAAATIPAKQRMLAMVACDSPPSATPLAARGLQLALTSK